MQAVLFPRPQCNSVPQKPRLPYGITQYYLPLHTGKPVPSLPYIWEEGQIAVPV